MMNNINFMLKLYNGYYYIIKNQKSFPALNIEKNGILTNQFFRN